MLFQQKIHIAISSSSSLVKEAVEKFKEKIMSETLALSLEENLENADGENTIDANNESVTIKVKK